MAFIQSCFIRKNTPELRNKLQDMGYRQNIYDKNEYPWLAVNHNMFISVSEGFERLPEFNIDCGTNEELFLALAALRDDMDKNQYWICDKVSVTIGKTYYPGDYIYYQYDEFFDKQNWHKATVEEIIEHFK